MKRMNLEMVGKEEGERKSENGCSDIRHTNDLSFISSASTDSDSYVSTFRITHGEKSKWRLLLDKVETHLAPWILLLDSLLLVSSSFPPSYTFSSGTSERY